MAVVNLRSASQRVFLASATYCRKYQGPENEGRTIDSSTGACFAIVWDVAMWEEWESKRIKTLRSSAVACATTRYLRVFV